MRDLLFTFEEEKVPSAVILATSLLILLFVVGILFRVSVGLLF